MSSLSPGSKCSLILSSEKSKTAEIHHLDSLRHARVRPKKMQVMVPKKKLTRGSPALALLQVVGDPGIRFHMPKNFKVKQNMEMTDWQRTPM